MRLLIAIATMLTAISPAAAQRPTETFNVQSVADCTTNFRIVDDNRDGWLSEGEMSTVPQVVPTTLLGQTPISRQDYLKACEQQIQFEQQ